MLGNGKVLPWCSHNLLSYSLLRQGCYQSSNAFKCFKPPLMRAWCAWAVPGLLCPTHWKQPPLGWDVWTSLSSCSEHKGRSTTFSRSKLGEIGLSGRGWSTVRMVLLPDPAHLAASLFYILSGR